MPKPSKAIAKTIADNEAILGARIPDALDPRHTDLLLRASARFLAQRFSFAGLLLNKSKIVFSERIPTAAVGYDNQLYQYYFNAEYMASLSMEEIIFMLYHESMHRALEHIAKGYIYDGCGDDQLPGVPIPPYVMPDLDPKMLTDYAITHQGHGYLPFSQQGWNVATDLYINRLGVEGGIGRINKDWLYDNDYDTGTMTEEGTYCLLFKQAWKHLGQPTDQLLPAGDPMPGQSNAPQNAPQAPQPDDSNDTLKDMPRSLEDVNAQCNENAQRMHAAEKLAGTESGIINRLVERFDTARLRWKKKYFNTVMSTNRGHSNASYRRADRRRLASTGLIFPTRYDTQVKDIVIAIDTSGSMSEAELSTGMSETAGVITQIKPKRLIVLPTDSRIHNVIDLKDLKPTTNFINTCNMLRDRVVPLLGGGGGTSFAPPFDWVAKNKIKPQCLIYFLDGYGKAPAHPPKYPVVWVTTGASDFVDWGTMIVMAEAI